MERSPLGEGLLFCFLAQTSQDSLGESSGSEFLSGTKSIRTQLINLKWLNLNAPYAAPNESALK